MQMAFLLSAYLAQVNISGRFLIVDTHTDFFMMIYGGGKKEGSAEGFDIQTKFPISVAMFMSGI